MDVDNVDVNAPGVGDVKSPSPNADKPWVYKAAIAAVPITLTAWCIYFFNGDVAMVLGCVAFVVSIIGVRTSRSCLRDLSVSCIIASAVLVVVYSLFSWILPAML